MRQRDCRVLRGRSDLGADRVRRRRVADARGDRVRLPAVLGPAARGGRFGERPPRGSWPNRGPWFTIVVSLAVLAGLAIVFGDRGVPWFSPLPTTVATWWVPCCWWLSGWSSTSADRASRVGTMRASAGSSPASRPASVADTNHAAAGSSSWPVADEPSPYAGAQPRRRPPDADGVTIEIRNQAVVVAHVRGRRQTVEQATEFGKSAWRARREVQRAGGARSGSGIHRHPVSTDGSAMVSVRYRRPQGDPVGRSPSFL